MFKLILIFSGILFCSSALSEMHVWTFENGSTIEAEFITVASGQIILRNAKGKTKKIPKSHFIEKDLNYIELLSPPKLDLSVRKTTTQRIYPPTYNDQELPRSSDYIFKATIKQTSSNPYNSPLTVELFVVGEENMGDKEILYGYEKKEFYLENGSKSRVEFKSEAIRYTEYVSYGQLRGEAYEGYMIIVTDLRGEIIAYKAKKESWLENIENLRKIPVGKTFNKTCIRCLPTRPGKFY